MRNLQVSPDRFAVGSKSTAPSAAKAKVPRGTTIRYKLSQGATVHITIQQRLSGRVKNGRCVKPTSKLKNNKRCTRYVTKQRITRNQLGGARSLRYTGRVGKNVLVPGRYRLLVFATDTAGDRSAQRTRGFRVLAAQ